MTNMSPTINTLCIIIICNIDVSGVMPLNKNIAIPTNTMPGTIITFGLNLSNSLPAIGPIMALIILPGSMIIPDLKAVTSKTVCRNIGNKVIVENNDIITMTINPTDNVNIGTLNARNSKIGFSIFNCQTTKIHNEISPTIKVPYTFASDHPKSPDALKLYTSPPNPNVDKRIDG